MCSTNLAGLAGQAEAEIGQIGRPPRAGPSRSRGRLARQGAAAQAAYSSIVISCRSRHRSLKVAVTHNGRSWAQSHFE